MAGPEDWLTPETVERHAPGFLIGSAFTAVVILRIIRSGLIVFSDKATLLVEKAKLEAQVEHLLGEIKERDRRIAELSGKETIEQAGDHQSPETLVVSDDRGKIVTD